jgi:hypothetical protein
MSEALKLKTEAYGRLHDSLQEHLLAHNATLADGKADWHDDYMAVINKEVQQVLLLKLRAQEQIAILHAGIKRV